MWKWILIGVGVVLGLVIFAGIFIVTMNPKGCVDFVLTNIDEFNVSVEGEQHKVRISELEGDLTPDDRAYLVKKMITLTIMSHENEQIKEASAEYGRAFLEMAEDHVLTEEEFRKLKDMHADLVTDEDIENWLKRAQELEDDPDFDPGELF